MASLKGEVEVQVDTGIDQLRNSVGDFYKGIPEMNDEVAEEFAKNLAQNITKEVDRKFDRFDGKLRDVDYRPAGQIEDGVRYDVDASARRGDVNYAAWHEFAKSGHTAPVRGDLKRWAQQKGILDDIGTGLRVEPMNQRKGSFMQPAIQNSISEQRRKLRGSNPVSRNLNGSFKS